MDRVRVRVNPSGPPEWRTGIVQEMEWVYSYNPEAHMGLLLLNKHSVKHIQCREI